MASQFGNYLCHSLSIGGCEYSHVVSGVGYAAIIIPIIAVALLFTHLIHH